MAIHSGFGALADKTTVKAQSVGSRRGRRVGLILFAILLVVSWWSAEIRPSALLSASAASAVWQFVSRAFPPDFSLEFLRTVLIAAGQTIAIATVGTLLSIILALPLGILSTATLWERGTLAPTQRRGSGYSLMIAASRTVRAVLGFLRAVPDMIWGLLFVVAVGLGSLAGTLALAVSYSGVLGRVYASVFESVDPLPLEALQSTGATRAQIFLRGIWPQAKPSIIGYTLYSFECSVRAASVLGFVGAGGLGYEVNISMRLFEYRQVSTLILAFVVLISATDAFSRFVRQGLRSSSSAPQASWLIALGGDLFGGGRYTKRRGRYLAGLALIVILVPSLLVSGIDPGALLTTGLPGRVGRFIGGMFPPTFDLAFLKSLAIPLLQTIGISVMGTVIGVVLGSALAVPATATIALAEADAGGRTSVPERLAGWCFYYPARLVLNILRSIPELVWVLLCILVAGLGPFAGTLAIGLHTGGVLGRLYAETLEEVPVKPIEALRAAGAGRLQVLIWGIWPQARPLITSYTVLRWEANLRVSTILGLVGGGGLGQVIYNSIQLGFYQRVGTLILIIYGLVLTTDWLGDRRLILPVEGHHDK